MSRDDFWFEFGFLLKIWPNICWKNSFSFRMSTAYEVVTGFFIVLGLSL